MIWKHFSLHYICLTLVNSNVNLESELEDKTKPIHVRFIYNWAAEKHPTCICRPSHCIGHSKLLSSSLWKYHGRQARSGGLAKGFSSTEHQSGSCLIIWHFVEVQNQASASPWSSELLEAQPCQNCRSGQLWICMVGSWKPARWRCCNLFG